MAQLVKQSINIGSSPNDGTGDTARAAFDKINDNSDLLFDVKPISLRDFGAVGDGVTNDGAALIEWRNYLNANGGVFYMHPNDIYLNAGALDLTLTPTKDFIIHGNYATIQRGTASIGGAFSINNASGVNGKVQSLNVNPKNADFANNTHAMVLIDGGGIIIDDVHFTDWSDSCILAYPSGASTGRTIIRNCSGNGLGVAKNGFLFDKHLNSLMENCYMTGVDVSSPGYAFQNKNLSKRCISNNLTVNDCYAGFAAGQTEEVGGQDCVVNNLIANNCDIGIITGFVDGFTFNTAKINMESRSGSSHAIRLQHSQQVNIQASIRNVLNNRHCVFFEEADTPAMAPRENKNNYVEIMDFDNANGGTAGGNVPLVRFGLDVSNNIVKIIASDRLSSLNAAFTVDDDNGTDSGLNNRVIVNGTEIYAS